MGASSVAAVARAIDHAVLKPEATADDLARQAEMCVARGVGCLCVRPCDVALAARLVAGTPVVVASVVGFPHGSHRRETKAVEARLAIADGARELDMVLAIGRLRAGDETAVHDDIAAVVAEAVTPDVVVKVILETCLLTPAQIVAACRIAEAAGTGFVKTSTGFAIQPHGPTGATPEVVRIMLDAVGGRIGVKASGGIRTWDDAVMYLSMGCRRLGVSDAAAILDGGVIAGAY